MRHQVIAYAQKENQFAVTVQDRIIECAKGRAHVAKPGNLSVEHVEQTGKEDECACPADIGEVASAALFGAGDKNDGHADIQDQSDRSDHIGGKTSPDQQSYQGIDYLVYAQL